MPGWPGGPHPQQCPAAATHHAETQNVPRPSSLSLPICERVTPSAPMMRASVWARQAVIEMKYLLQSRRKTSRAIEVADQDVTHLRFPAGRCLTCCHLLKIGRKVLDLHVGEEFFPAQID